MYLRRLITWAWGNVAMFFLSSLQSLQTKFCSLSWSKCFGEFPAGGGGEAAAAGLGLPPFAANGCLVDARQPERLGEYLADLWPREAEPVQRVFEQADGHIPVLVLATPKQTRGTQKRDFFGKLVRKVLFNYNPPWKMWYFSV